MEIKCISGICCSIFIILFNFAVSAANVPDSMKKPVYDSVADRSWLTGTSEEALENLKKWYTPARAQELWPAIKEFRKQQTGWPQTYQVNTIALVSRKENEAVVRVEILEISPDNSKVILQGVYNLKKIADDWKIDSFHIQPKEEQNIDTL